MAHTLQLEVPEDVYELLARIAKQTGQPPEQLAARWLSAATRSLANDPLEKFIGAFKTGISDWADEHDDYIGKSILEVVSSEADDGS
jgi:protein involved in temperature-dependent protein secretion